MQGDTLLLVVALPAGAAVPLAQLRAHLAPAAAARAPLHLALFRHLPGPQAAQLAADVRRLAAATPRPRLWLAPPAARERMVEVRVTSPELLDLRATLARWWGPLLLAAERGEPRLHLTLASGLAPAAARSAAAQAIEALPHQRFSKTGIAATALQLMRHGRPHHPWATLCTARFAG